MKPGVLCTCQGRWPGVSDGLCLGGLPVARRPAYRSGARSKRLRYGIQCSRMRLSARRPAQNHLAASRDSEAIKMSTRPGPRRLGCSRQRQDEGGLLPLAGSPILSLPELVPIYPTCTQPCLRPQRWTRSSRSGQETGPATTRRSRAWRLARAPFPTLLRQTARPHAQKVVSHELVACSHLSLIPDLFEVASNEFLVGI